MAIKLPLEIKDEFDSLFTEVFCEAETSRVVNCVESGPKPCPIFLFPSVLALGD